MAATTSTIPTAEVGAGRSTNVQQGDCVLVKIDEAIRRPMMVAALHPDGSVSGTIFCEADDHTRPAFRGWSDQSGARITGRPDRLLPQGYGELLQPGPLLGQWIPRPTLLSGRS